MPHTKNHPTTNLHDDLIGYITIACCGNKVTHPHWRLMILACEGRAGCMTNWNCVWGKKMQEEAHNCSFKRLIKKNTTQCMHTHLLFSCGGKVAGQLSPHLKGSISIFFSNLQSYICRSVCLLWAANSMPVSCMYWMHGGCMQASLPALSCIKH